ncbi:hypothetical protein CTEN210_18017 [Chaetoceros tenuissimus]|uniref:Leucine-rich repeat domain-containing protein n=1 Tax=Chaetoceros tenuissimus TaxID=426638 RepID=A0AAD3DBY6_9STRA|nr:hypothetical protein CTEN210_18017 [Chaetoceros tenuissimus]
MRFQTEEWCKFTPGIRMYKGEKTYFYNGEKLWERDWYTGHPLIYDHEERQSWEVIIILPGVRVIPTMTFGNSNIKAVIMADDSVERIEDEAFYWCKKIAFVKFSRKLEFIGDDAFQSCESLNSIFIPDSCRQIGNQAFDDCKMLIILQQHTELVGPQFSFWTPLLQLFIGEVRNELSFDEVNRWVKSINGDDEYGLHRLCSSMHPSEDEICQMINEEGGIHAMTEKNSIDITPSDYLAANPYADVDEMKLMKRFVLEKMGKIV